MNSSPRRVATSSLITIIGCAMFLPARAGAEATATAEMDPAAAQSSTQTGSASPADMPTTEQLTFMLRNTLSRVDYGNKTGDYHALYAALTPQVQQKVDVQKLADAMSGFRELKVDMAPALKIQPHYDRPPEMGTDGLLTMRGALGTQPRPIRFDLAYLRIAGDWRVQVLNLDTPPGQNAADAPKTANAQSAESSTKVAQAPTTQTPMSPAEPASAPAPTPVLPQRPAVAISPYLDPSTDPPTASKW
jgi:hypothetical protein